MASNWLRLPQTTREQKDNEFDEISRWDIKKQKQTQIMRGGEIGKGFWNKGGILKLQEEPLQLPLRGTESPLFLSSIK